MVVSQNRLYKSPSLAPVQLQPLLTLATLCHDDVTLWTMCSTYFYHNSNDSQCQINMGAIDAAAVGPFKKQAHSHGWETENLLYFACDFFVWFVQFRKIIKTVATRCHILKLKCTTFDFAPQPRWESLQRSPDLLTSWGPTSRGKERGREREVKDRAKGEGEGNG